MKKTLKDIKKSPFGLFWRLNESSYVRADSLFVFLMKIVCGGQLKGYAYTREFKALMCTSKWMRELMRKFWGEVDYRGFQNVKTHALLNKRSKKKGLRQVNTYQKRYESYKLLYEYLKVSFETKNKVSLSKDHVFGEWTVEEIVYKFNKWCEKYRSGDYKRYYFTEYWLGLTSTYIYYKRDNGNIVFETASEK